jgi:uncharacterized protein YbjQ (UPF0145 family)
MNQLNQLVHSRVIRGKSVYVFESHNMALVPWGECRRAVGQAPRLFTLDYHTDTRPAFVGAATHQPGSVMPRPSGVWEPIAQRLVDAIPPRLFEKIATIDASSQGSLTFTQQKMDKAIQRLKEEAAKVGANGVLPQGSGSQSVGSVGSDFGTATATGHSAYGTGVGISGNILVQAANGIAIYVTEE